MEQEKPRKSSNWKLFLVLAVCAAPVVASYLTYYVIKPEGRTNYGDLIDPRAHPIPALGATTVEGKPAELADYKGKWIMLQIADGDCNQECRTKLYEMRQLRLAQGKDKDRIERVWLVTDQITPDSKLMTEYAGTRLLRVDEKMIKAWLPAAESAVPSDHLYLIDPLGNLMMRFPKNGDPNKMKKDISKLLKASRIG